MRSAALLIIIIATFTSANSARATPALSTDLPQFWLGKGLVGKYNFRRQVKWLDREMTKFAKNNHKEVMPRSHWEQYLKPGDVPYFLGMACVGKSANGRTNCYKVQPTLINLSALKVIKVGPILLIGEPAMSASLQKPTQSDPEPTHAQIRKFIRELKQEYRDYLGSDASKHLVPALGRMLLVGVSASKSLSNQDGWNWADQATPVTDSAFEAFEGFIMKYQSEVTLTQKDLERAFALCHDSLDEMTHWKAIGIVEAEKRKTLIETAFPNN